MFEQCLYFNTASLARKLEREWALAFKPFGLTPAQAFMLRVLLEKNPLLLSDLAIELHLSRPTTSRILDGLEKMAFIKRVASQKDGREFEIYPTQIAIYLKIPLNDAAKAVTMRIKHLFGETQFMQTVTTLRQIESLLS